MGDAKEVRLRFSRVIRRRPIPYIPHHNLLQRQQMEQERRRLSAVVAPNAGASGSESEEQTLPIMYVSNIFNIIILLKVFEDGGNMWFRFIVFHALVSVCFT